MFGDIPFVGETNVTVKNNSIKLPNFTMSEYNDNICLLKTNFEIRMYSEEEFNKLIKKIIDKYNNGNLSIKNKYDIIRYICGRGYDEVKVNKEHKIKSLKFLKENLELMLVGSNDHIKLLTKEQYYSTKKV